MKKLTLALLAGAALNSGIFYCQKIKNSATSGNIQISLSNEQNKYQSELLPGLNNPPQAGSTEEFTYISKNGLEHAKDVKGLVYIYSDYKWKLDDVETTPKGDVYSCKYQIPKDCAFLAFKFYATTPESIIVDTNKDEGYIFTTVTDENQKLPGSDFAWGTFRNANLNGDFGQYFDEFTISDEASEFWVKKEIQEHPEKFLQFVDTYFKIAKLRKPEKFDTIARLLADQFLGSYKELTEDQYTKMYNLYAFELKDKKAADSLQELILKRFPNGHTAQLNAFQASSQISDESQRALHFEAFLKEYPVTKLEGSQPFFYRNIFNFLGEYFFTTEQYDKLEALLPQMNFANIVECYHFNISKAFHFKSLPTPVLNELSESMIAEMQSKIDDSSYEQDIYISAQQARENAVNQLDSKLKVQMRISADLKKDQDVIKYWSYLSEGAKYKDSAINEIYIKALANEQKDLLQALEAAAKNTALTPQLTELFKKVYTEKNGSEVGFDDYLNNFKNHELKAELRHDLINEQAPELVFEDYDGKEVQLNSEGKIIILDFWANWCAPCKKSFPAMQQLVEDHQDDKTVAFYFINTSETTSDYKTFSASYFKKSQLNNLKILFDQKPENSRSNTVSFSEFASLFNSSGIPRKVVIKDGKIRFTSEGYSGNPDELKNEITTVIELLKSENGYE